MQDTLQLPLCEKFHCLADKCPMSCCKGWQIPVDEKTIEEYQKVKGIAGRGLRIHIIKKEPARIRRMLGKCPFLNSDGLCQHQLNGVTELMPVVCRVFPRRVIDFGYKKEVTLELSCPAAGMAFMETLGRQTFIPTGTDFETLWHIENDDKSFLDFLDIKREELLDNFWSDEDMGKAWQDGYAFVYNLHDLIIRDRLSEAKKILYTTDKKSQGEYAIYKENSLAFFSLKTIDRMLLEHIDYGLLIIRMPRFYKLIRRYLKTFSKLTVTEADRFFNESVTKMCRDNPNLYEKYRSYFSYNVLQLFLTGYENYFILKEYLLGVLYTQLLMLFDLMEYNDKGSISLKRQIEILNDCEHGIRHNPALTRNLYNVIREEFL